MPDPASSTACGAFISRALRPSVEREDVPPPLAPGTTESELRRRAKEMMGPGLLERLGLGARSTAVRPGQVARRNPQVIGTSMDGEAVLLNLDSGYYYTLNPSGTVIWELIAGERTMAEVRDGVCHRFDVAAEAAWDDLALLIRHLEREKLITVEEPANGGV